MTEDRLNEIEARVNACPPGPWYVREDQDYYRGGTYIGSQPYHVPWPQKYNPATNDFTWPGPCPETGRIDGFRPEVCLVEHVASEAFLTHARQDVPDLVAEVRRLRGLVERAATESSVAGYGGETVNGCAFCGEMAFLPHEKDCPAGDL